MIRWLAALLGVLVLLGLELATVHRASSPVGLGPFGSQGAWVSLWLVGSTLAIAGLTTAISSMLDATWRLPRGAAGFIVLLATVVATAVQGVGVGLLALPLAAVAFGWTLEDELPGWGGAAAVVLATAPGVLAGANELWLVATGLAVLALAHPAGLPLGIVAAILDPVAGWGLAGAWAASGRGRIALVPLLAASLPLVRQLDPSDPVIAPALGLVVAAIALGWPFALLGLLSASPRWVGMAFGMCAAVALVGPDSSEPLIVPITAGCLAGSVRILGARRALALWVATVGIVTIGYTPRVLQLPDLGSMLSVEER